MDIMDGTDVTDGRSYTVHSFLYENLVDRFWLRYS